MEIVHWVTGLFKYYLPLHLEYKLHKDRDLFVLFGTRSPFLDQGLHRKQAQQIYFKDININLTW